MPKRQPSFTDSPPVADLVSERLPRLIEAFLLAGEINQHSERTRQTRRERLHQLLWFVRKREIAFLDLDALRAFFHYLGHGHEEPGGRWGNPRHTKPLSSGTVKSYHATLRTFFAWLVAEAEIGRSPMERIPPPVDRPDQVQPFTEEQLMRLHAAAKRGPKKKGERRASPRRDEAIFLLLLDTGIRVSELCAVTFGDVDLSAGLLRVRHGKGGKARSAPFSGETKRALYNYLRERGMEADAAGEPLFFSERGRQAGEALTRNGVLQLIRRWARAAGISGVRCSPHTFRHTFAISFLRAGGNVFTLKEILGHTSLTMVNRYVALAQADIVRQHAQFSPVARLRSLKKR